MPQSHNAPSQYEMLTGHFSGDLDLHQTSEENQVILSMLDKMQGILNCCALRWRIYQTMACRI